ncbi:nucleotidyltransferase family protein [Desulfurobacterium sp.]
MRDEILVKLRGLKKKLQEVYGIEEIAIFGSVARSECTENSDVDIVILKMKKKNGFKIAGARNFLKNELNRNVDLGLYDSLNPFVKENVKKEMIGV